MFLQTFLPAGIRVLILPAQVWTFTCEAKQWFSEPIRMIHALFARFILRPLCLP